MSMLIYDEGDMLVMWADRIWIWKVEAHESVQAQVI